MKRQKSSTTSRRLSSAALCLSALAFTGASDAGDGTALPPLARDMNGVELYMLYHDKTWQWPDGAGRTESDGRRFTAWAGSGEKATWAEGRWIVTDRGRLCLDAMWHSLSGAHPNRTCFSHRSYGDAILQRKEPTGDWYIFKNPEPAADDEFSKLVGLDLVSPHINAIKSAVEEAQNASTPKSTEGDYDE